MESGQTCAELPVCSVPPTKCGDSSTEYRKENCDHREICNVEKKLRMIFTLYLLKNTESIWDKLHKLTCCGALPMKVDGSKSWFKWEWIGRKYSQLSISFTKLFSLPNSLTSREANWESTRISSWHSCNCKSIS